MKSLVGRFCLARSLASAVSVLVFFGGGGLGALLLGLFSASFSFCLPSFFWGPARASFSVLLPPPTEVAGHPRIHLGGLHTCMSLFLSLSLSPSLLAWVGSPPPLLSSPLLSLFSLSLSLSLARISNTAKGTGLEESVGKDDPASLTQSDIVKRLRRRSPPEWVLDPRLPLLAVDLCGRQTQVS